MLDSGPESPARFGAMTTYMRLYLADLDALLSSAPTRRLCATPSSRLIGNRSRPTSNNGVPNSGYGIFMALWEESAPQAG
jgi:hypothetical protein